MLTTLPLSFTLLSPIELALVNLGSVFVVPVPVTVPPLDGLVLVIVKFG
jgi:hypothetical protein